MDDKTPEDLDFHVVVDADKEGWNIEGKLGEASDGPGLESAIF